MAARARMLVWCVVALAVLAAVAGVVAVGRSRGARERLNPADGAALVWVPPGEFAMGDDGVRVHLDGYWIYRYEVTVGQYRQFCRATNREAAWLPASTPDNLPVQNVTWTEAMAYAAWAGGDLPTGAEWERAAAGTDQRLFPWGNTWDDGACNNAHVFEGRRPPIAPHPTPGGAFARDRGPCGAMDMAGNVSEWTLDSQVGVGVPGLYSRVMSGRNPRTSYSPSEPMRLVRGGNYATAARPSRPESFLGANTQTPRSFVARTYYPVPMDARAGHGFRCVIREARGRP